MTEAQAGHRHLYVCESVYQLFNAIVLRLSVLPDVPADVILTEHTDFSAIARALETTGVFDEVLRPVCRPLQDVYYAASPAQREAYLRAPETLIGDPLKRVYTDFFVAIDHIYPKMLYYRQLQKGMKPAVHFFEEGMRAYTIDIRQSERTRDPIVTSHYGADSFARNIVDHYLYVPELFAVSDPAYELKAIPKINRNDARLRDTLTTVFGTSPLPPERFLFFEESNYCDHQLTNDFQLFEQVVQLVGKENIIVKRHPRNTVDRFTDADRGYQVMKGHGIPWEMQLLHNDVSHKIFVTIVSTASVTPFFLFGQPAHTIHLKGMFHGKSSLLNDKAFAKFYHRMIEYFNREERMIHTPQSETELREIIRYLNATV